MNKLIGIATLLVAASSMQSMAESTAASVDVTKDGWWLTPYKATKEWTIGVSYTDVSISYIAALQKAVQNKAKEMGVKIIEVDAKNDTNIELSNVEDLLQHKIDLLLFEGASLKASGASIEAANKANIPVVHFNILAEGGQYVTFVGSNQIDSGIIMGKQIVKLYKELGKPTLNGIYMRGIAGYITDEVRNQGVKDTLKEAGIADKINWTEQHADFSRAKAQSVAESILNKSPDHDFVIANGDDDPGCSGCGQVGRPARQGSLVLQRRRPSRGPRRDKGWRHRFDRVSESGRARRRRDHGCHNVSGREKGSP